MTNNHFYRCYAESQDGDVGTCFYEIDGNLVTRQIWDFNGHLFWANSGTHKDPAHEFTDQPEWNDGDGAIDLIETDAASFEKIWAQAGGPAASGPEKCG